MSSMRWPSVVCVLALWAVPAWAGNLTVGGTGS